MAMRLGAAKNGVSQQFDFHAVPHALPIVLRAPIPEPLISSRVIPPLREQPCKELDRRQQAGAFHAIAHELSIEVATERPADDPEHCLAAASTAPSGLSSHVGMTPDRRRFVGM
jgi:hypothetical protein